MLTANLPAVNAKERNTPYIWVTWLSSLMTGESNCMWATWFQANYKFDKSSGDLNNWKIKHTRLLNKRIGKLEAEGFKVYVEDENKFTITGKNGITKVAGKADIVAIKGKQIIVEDCKTGKKKNSDLTQVLIYMMLLPAPGGAPHCRGKKLEGRLVYSDESMDIPSSMIDQDFKGSFRELVYTVSNRQPARKVPSPRECKFCKIPKDICTERAKAQPTNVYEQHDLF